MTTLSATIQEAIRESIETTSRVRVEGTAWSETELISALHSVDDYLDRTEESGAERTHLDVWGGEGALAWRLLIQVR